MKKICAFILSVFIFFAVNLPILAQSVSNPKTNEVTPDKNIIVCDSNSSNNDLCSKFSIFQEKIELNSNLKKYYKANLYKIQNNLENDVEIIFIENIEEGKKVAKKDILNRKKNHASKICALFFIPMFCLVTPAIIVFPVAVLISAPILLYESTAGNIALAIGNKKILKEAKKFQEYSLPVSVKKGESLSLLLLVDEKKVNGAGINFLLKNIQTNQCFTINKGIKVY